MKRGLEAGPADSPLIGQGASHETNVKDACAWDIMETIVLIREQ